MKSVHRIVFILLLTISFCLTAQEQITINPAVRYQKIKGWGVSLSWWANDVGNKFSVEDLNVFCRWLTDPTELNMNIFRYNISGGDNPSHKHMRKDAQVEGYKNAENEPYTWTNDSAQRKVLLMVHTLRPDGVFEAANYSPPYWMTKSGCSSGDSTGLDNLNDDYYDDFAQYLVDCVKHYKDKYGITFSTISPINEPFSDWWKAKGSQEGCAFSQNNQERIIRELYKKLKLQKMLAYTGISAMDANNIDECLSGVEGYKKDRIIPLIKQINVHSYAGSKRSELNLFAVKNHIPLWQSESGPLNVRLSGFDNFLFMSKRIVTDMRELKPEVWCDWQYAGAGFGGVWALVGYNGESKTMEKTKGFYCRKQFSHFIKSGFIFVENDNQNVLTAISQNNKEMVVVIVNQDSIPKTYNLKVKNMKVKSLNCIRTSENEDFVSVPQTLTQSPTGLSVVIKEKSVNSIFLTIK